MTNNKIVIYFGGGVMAGVFSAGIIKKLQDMDIYDKIEAVYGGSCGSINAAYFLTKQADIGYSVFCEDLTHDFIYKFKIFPAFLQRIYSSLIYRIPRGKMINVVNLNYLFNILKFQKRLDVDRLKKQPIPFYAKVFNLNQDKIQYLDVKKYNNPFKILKASVDVVPYVSDFEGIDGEEYVDGTILESINLQYFLDKYPSHKIVIISNTIVKRQLRHYIKSFFESLAAISVYGSKAIGYFIKGEFQLRKDIAYARRTKNVLFISPPKNSLANASTTDPVKLKQTYKLGMKEAEKIKELLY
jgi:predicted patatin/cPLA2 family phospholipase